MINILASKIYKFKISDMDIAVTIDNSFTPNPSLHSFAENNAVKGMHCHALHELFFVKNSSLIVLSEDQNYEFKNCVVCIPPMFVHNSIRHNDFRILFSYNITSEKASDFSAFLDSFFSSKSPASANIDPSFEVYFQQLFDFIHICGSLADELVTSLLKLIFFNIYNCNANIEKKEISLPRDSYLVTIDSFLTNYQNNINLKTMAEALNLSTKQTSRIIKKNYNCTLSELVNLKRLGVAKALLAKSDMPISAIVEHINFPSESYFYHQFKKTYGCTPLKYRKNKKVNM